MEYNREIFISCKEVLPIQPGPRVPPRMRKPFPRKQNRISIEIFAAEKASTYIILKKSVKFKGMENIRKRGAFQVKKFRKVDFAE